MAAVNFRYARALEDVVVEQKLNGEAIKQQLADFQATLSGSHELFEALDNPSIAEQQKLNLLDAMAQKMGFEKAVRNFIMVVIRHGRLMELADILAAYDALADEDANIAEVEVTSARVLEDASRATLEAKIAKLADGRKVSATYSQDAALLGGAVVKIGSTVYDGSVRGQLEQLKQKLLTATA
jgi:F-type H+-transporting ATPase subunit delta